MRSLARIGLGFLFVAQLSLIGFAQSGTITTYAGPQLPVNGAWATTQHLDSPSAVVSDGAGGFYVAIPTQNRVYRVTANNRLRVVAGAGPNGFSGDGGQATSARLHMPEGVTVDTEGNLFIADTYNNRVRKVTPGGMIATVAGNGIAGYSGDGGPATSAELNGPADVSVDTSGNLYIADTGNNSVRKVTLAGVISTMAGNGTSGFSGDGGPAISSQLDSPQGLTVDTAGNLFISDTDNLRVRKVTPGGVIVTVAGGGSVYGEGGPATSAQLQPIGLSVDAAGSLFIADTGNNRVCKVTAGGVISSVTASGLAGWFGDGRPANFALVNYPLGVAVDAAGNLFIADSGNNCIRLVAPSGIMSTVAGIGIQHSLSPLTSYGLLAPFAALDGPGSVAVDAAGNLFIADTGGNRIRKVTPSGIISTVAGNGIDSYGGDGGAATSAWLNLPYGVAVDTAGNVFIADTYNHRIRKVTPDGGISTVAGNGTLGFGGDGGPATSAMLFHPYGIAVDTAGNVFIADTGNNRIRKVTPGGMISTVAGSETYGEIGDGGPATSARLSYPHGVAVDAAGNIFIADMANHRIRKVTPGGVISTVAGGGTYHDIGDGGPATSAWLDVPNGVAVDTAGNLFIADAGNSRIRKVSPDGIISTFAGNGTMGFSGDGGPATSAMLDSPNGVAVDTVGNLIIADSRNSRIRKVTPSGVIGTVAGDGTFGYSGDGGTAVSAQLYRPSGVVLDTAGNLFSADNASGFGVIRKVTPDGLMWLVAGPPSSLLNPFGIALDTVGNLFMANYGANIIKKMTPGGVMSTVAGNGFENFGGDGGPATSAMLWGPLGVAVDGTGDIFIADTGNNRVRKVTPDGIISTVAGSGYSSSVNGGFSGDGGQATSARLNQPGGVAIDTAGNLFIADTNNHRIRKVTPAGVISTLAGNGTGGYSGDGGPATSAELNYPIGVAVDAAGNLFIGDTNNHRVRKVTPGGIISTVAGNGALGFSGDGGPATSAQIYSPIGVTVDTAGNLFIADYNNNRIRKVAAGPTGTINLTLSADGSASAGTAGLEGGAQAGYAAVGVNLGAAPYGTAVFSRKQSGVTVSETGVPASPPTTSARLFIDYRSSVAAIPGRISAGSIDINTGIAVANTGSASASITYTLRHVGGGPLSIGHGTLAAGNHFAKFIDELNQVAADFVLPANFQSAIQFASLEISSDRPLSILALRMTTNQRNEALLTTTPIADLTKPATSDAVFFPQFVDGGGYTTSLVLLNASDRIETGTLHFLNDDGNPLIFTEVGGTVGSMFRYSIPAGGAIRYQTDGSPAVAHAGWVKLTPDAETSTPVGAGVFSCNPGSFLVTESGIPATVATTHARVYVDMSGGHGTGLAIANPTNTNASITIAAFQSDGITGVGTSRGPLLIPANGHSARFADEFVAGLPAGFTGVLDIVSSTPFGALTMRSLYNERYDFLLATFPIADATRSAPSPIVFPQIADGGDFVTQFILIDAGGSSSVTLNFFGEDGKLLAVGK